MKPNYIRENLIVFIKSTIDNPSFSSQTKETLTTTKTKFGSTCEIPKSFIDSLAKTGIVDKAILLAEAKQNKKLKQTDGKKKEESPEFLSWKMPIGWNKEEFKVHSHPH